ncbi:MAG: Fic family protein [bacterium]
MDDQLISVTAEAALSIGRLDGISDMLPEMSLFLYFFIRKEALLSSQIEGTQSSLNELLLFEEERENVRPSDDVLEVSNHISALEFGVQRLQSLPLSLRFIRELHAILLAQGRGSARNPGEFRRSQNWIGGSRPGNAHYVPPPPELLMDCLGSLEQFMQSDNGRYSPVIKAALIHAQFESIHPFLDGNGRIGRLLISLYLLASGVTRHPILYLSLYFKRNRTRYYDLLQDTRSSGNFEDWVEFFLHGVIECAGSGIATATNLLATARQDADSLRGLGRRSGSLLQVHAALQRYPLTSAVQLSEETRLSLPTVNTALELMLEAGMVSEMTGQARHRRYRYDRYIDLISEGTEPL